MEESLDTQAWKAGYSSVPAFLRAQKRQKKLDDWQARNDQTLAESEEQGITGRYGRSSLDSTTDRPYPGSYLQRATQPQALQEQPKPSLIPDISPAEYKDAKDAYEWILYPHTLSDDRRRWIMKFAVALRLAIPGETWQGLDDTRKSLVTRLLNSEDAKLKFK